MSIRNSHYQPTSRDSRTTISRRPLEQVSSPHIPAKSPVRAAFEPDTPGANPHGNHCSERDGSKLAERRHGGVQSRRRRVIIEDC